jgi:hypothetical protein
MGTVKLVIPEEPLAPEAQKGGTRAFDNKALRIGLLDNAKGNADHLLAQIVARLKEEMPVASVVSRRKPGASQPAESSVIDDLVNESDVVISAMAD